MRGQGDAAALAALGGRIEDGRHRLPVRVYFEDTDFTGVVFHGAFVNFLERGRSDFLRLSGIDHRSLAAPAAGEPLFFALRALSLAFRAPARIDDVLLVETRLADVTGARVLMEQAILRGGAEAVRATAELCLVDGAGRPRRLPDALRSAFRRAAAGDDGSAAAGIAGN